MACQCLLKKLLVSPRLNFGWCWPWRRSLLRLFGRRFVLLTDPAFHADLSVNCVRFREAVIDRRAERVQWHLAFAIPFRARYFRAVQATRAAQTNPLRAEVHRDLDGLLHRAAIGDTALDLQRDVLGHELRVELRRLDLLNVDLDLLALRHLRNLFGHLLDLGAFASDDDARPGGVNGHTNRIPGALDDDLRDRCELQLLLHVI